MTIDHTQLGAVANPQPHTLARRSDPSTSHAAAATVAHFAKGHHDLILQAMKESGGDLGAEQIGDATGIQAYAVRKRLPELESAGLVKATALTRHTRAGRSERLWRLAGKG